MPMFFFRVRDGDDLIADTEGTEYENLDSALDEAERAGKELLANDLAADEAVHDRVFEITDTNEAVIGTVAIIARIDIQRRRLSLS